MQAPFYSLSLHVHQQTQNTTTPLSLPERARGARGARELVLHAHNGKATVLGDCKLLKT